MGEITYMGMQCMLIELIDAERPEPIVVSGKTCRYTSNYFEGDDCYYDADFPCEECVFVVGRETKDKRRGKRPWRKQND